MPASKNALDIRLTESVVFLRGGDGTGRHRSGTQPNAPPAMIRGLLTLTLVKPTKISSIEVELLGKTSTAWPEGVGARRVEISEDHKIYSQTHTFYKAGSTPNSHRRTLSVGPGLYVEHDRDQEHDGEYDEQSDESSTQDHAVVEERRGRDPVRGQQRGRAPRRMYSVDQTTFQADYVAHRNNQLPTPPYSPPYSPSPDATPLRRSPAPSVIAPLSIDDSPTHSSEEFRRAGGASEHSSYRGRSESRHGTPVGSIYSPVDGSLSRRVSLDEQMPEFIIGSSTQPPAYTQPVTPQLSHINGSSPHHAPSSPHSHEDTRGRKNKRSSLGVFFDAVKDRVRSVSRAEHDTPPHSLTRENSMERMDTSFSRISETSLSRRGRTKERTTLERVSEVMGWEVDENEVGEGWKEFRKGVYTYPISFAIPADSPPTLQCEFGSVFWRLKACAHRPGAFTAKLSATKDVTVVASPGEDDTEDTESIIVERQWDTQMQYLIAISGRSFPIGGIIPFSITFVPWTKMKVFRLSVVIEERVDYFTDFKRLVRTDPITRVVLLSLKDPHKDHPLLPLESDDIEAFKGSALYGTVSSDDDLSDIISNLMGPGPWSVSKNIELPKSCTDLHFTNKNKKSNITISHTLKVIFRVQRGDDEELDTATGKRKMFDIVVQTPIHILSCLCGPDYTALPPYSQLPTTAATVSAQCLCRSGSTLSSHPRENTTASPSDSGLLSPDSASLSRAYIGLSPTSSESLVTTVVRPPLPHLDSMLNGSAQFERLISGHESEIGEAPPAYEEVTTPPHIQVIHG